MKFCIPLLILTYISTLALVHSNEELCRFQDTCERCLGMDYNCAWCTDKKYEYKSERCLTRDELISNGCEETSVLVNHQEMSTVKDADLQDYEAESHRAVHVKPQRIKLKLVKSSTQQLTLKYRSARNNPLDLYYLMDLTYTMRDDKDTLVKLGAQLSKALRNLTENNRIGFGSFADKPAMPLIMPQLKENPCAAENQVCEPTYDFRHRIALTKDIDMFVRSVNESGITANLDNLEGGADALMQVITCTEAVGWMEEARKIVLLVSDGYMHFAGDGVLAGVTLRNDRQCHLDANGEYTGSLVYDYPSLEELYRELLRRKISVIFAVTPNVLETYKQISKQMEGISNVEKLSLDSSNILELIRTSYEIFLRRATMVDDSPPFIHVTYETTCGGQYKQLRKRNSCDHLELGQEIEFLVNVTLLDFPEDGQYRRRIRIGESSLSEYLDLDVEIQKPCPCEEELVSDAFSRSKCTDHGVMQCGMCRCDESWGGTFCNCNFDNATIAQDLERECQRPSSTKPGEFEPYCSHNGICECGICSCAEGYTGKYCECPECLNCDPETADCLCGQCICKYGWNGKVCNCKLKEDDCKAPNDEICSERGECHCSKCICEEGYSGVFCEVGTNAVYDNKLCEFYSHCVKCHIGKQVHDFNCGNLTDVCTGSRGQTYEVVFVATNISDANCSVSHFLDTSCNHTFMYVWLTPSETRLIVWINNCATLSELAMGGLWIALATFLFGLIGIVLYVCCIRIKDAKEYAQFERQWKGASVSEMNPLYKNPLIEYQVPRNDEDSF